MTGSLGLMASETHYNQCSPVVVCSENIKRANIHEIHATTSDVLFTTNLGW